MGSLTRYYYDYYDYLDYCNYCKSFITRTLLEKSTLQKELKDAKKEMRKLKNEIIVLRALHQDSKKKEDLALKQIQELEKQVSQKESPVVQLAITVQDQSPKTEIQNTKELFCDAWTQIDDQELSRLFPQFKESIMTNPPSIVYDENNEKEKDEVYTQVSDDFETIDEEFSDCDDFVEE